MHYVKPVLVGAAIYWVTQQVSGMSFIANASPTVAKFGPYLIAGGLSAAAHNWLK